MFKLLLLGLLQNTDYSDSMWDKAEQIPGGLIIQREIKKAANGQNYFINDEKTGKPIRLQSFTGEEFNYYYKLWEDFHYFGLPHGKGSAQERRWLLEFLKAFDRAFKDVEAFIQTRELRKPHGKHQFND